MEHRINCRQCRHFFITWEPRTPNGCRAMGFKSQVLPSIHVFQNSGVECRMFTPRRPAQDR
ncbi:MAG: uracil-DNA glycosylase [Candidatus Adiutrix sp.]|nr:uracil-DNA glycosylase [Candidatus Adiutrix sp.]